jgi:lysophospholipase L1-like esterase
LKKTIVACVVAFVTVTVTATVAFSSSPAPANSHVRAVALFVGDSNVAIAAEPINRVLSITNDHFNNGYIPVLAARSGSTIRTPDCVDVANCVTTDYWQGKLSELLAKVQPDVIVNNLGVNDLAQEGTETSPGWGRYRIKIDWFMSLIPTTTPVIWTNLPCSLLAPDRASACATVNYHLSLAKARWPNLTVINWSAASTGHPEYMASDQVHLTLTGQLAWADLVATTLDARFPAPST